MSVVGFKFGCRLGIWNSPKFNLVKIHKCSHVEAAYNSGTQLEAKVRQMRPRLTSTCLPKAKKKSIPTMKFALASSILAFSASASAFAPQTSAFARSSSLQSAVADETYTFTKSEEIFKEAQDVSLPIAGVCVPFFCWFLTLHFS